MNRIIHISEASSIAIHSLALISETGATMSVTRLAELTDFSKNHVSKVLLVLVKNGLLGSERGPKGGFSLKINPDQISLLEVIELLEGKIQENYCRRNTTLCPFDECIFGGIPEKLTKEFREYFAGRKISDLKSKSKSISRIIKK